VGAFFAPEFTGTQFRFLDPSHLAALVVIAAGCLALVFCWHSPGLWPRRAFRIGLAVLLLSVNISWQVWCLVNGTWSLQTHLPLHLCTAMVYFNALMLLTKSYRLYEFCYFAGIGGAIQALLTPDVGPYGFPHYGYFHFFVGHGASIAAAIYMTAVEGYRPHWRSLLRVAVMLNLYLLVVGAVNFVIGSNFMYLMYKPATPSLLDYLGPWPWYVVAAEPIGLAVFLLLYLPFAIRDRRAAAPGAPS